MPPALDELRGNVRSVWHRRAHLRCEAYRVQHCMRREGLGLLAGVVMRAGRHSYSHITASSRERWIDGIRWRGHNSASVSAVELRGRLLAQCV